MKYIRSFTDKKSGQNFDVEVEIDVDDLAQQLAARAFYAKAKKSQALQGSVKCSVIKIRKGLQC